MIPLVLVAYTHLWNPIGFPRIHPDEGYYIGRSIHVSEGLGPKEEAARYDHPYFGWLFLGGIFNIVGYPDSANPRPGDLNSIETVWLFPRAIIGILAVVDTFLIYKIAERRYNRTVAFIAAILFAVMPYTWHVRMVLIEPIQLPFLLTSILFALYSGTKIKAQVKSKQKSSLKELVKLRSRVEKNEGTGHRDIRDIRIESDKEKAREGEQKRRQIQGEGYDNNNYNEYKSQKIISNQNIILLLSSGIFLGLTIFAKIPAITLIPLVGFIILTNNKKSLKALGIWIIPVILIPMIWPLHALSVGDFDQWRDGLGYQTTRASKPLVEAINYFYREDSVLLILGLASFVFVSVTRRDFIFLIWVIPYLALFYILDYVSTFHLIPLIPAFCIGIAVMITDLSNKITKNKRLVRKILPFAIISAISIFGLTITTSMIVKTRNSSEFEVLALATQSLPVNNEPSNLIRSSDGIAKANSDEGESNIDDHVTIIGNSRQFWIFQYVFDKLEYDYKSKFNMISKATLENAKDGSEKIMMIADEGMKKIVSGEELPTTSKAEIKAERLSDLYNGTKTVSKTSRVEIRTNY